MTRRLELRLLGNPQVHLDGAVVSGFRTAKAEALLYYLAVNNRPHSREHLATLLWGDMPEATAKRNLTQVLSLLRKQFEPFLQIEPQQIGLKPEVKVWVDVHQFQQALTSANSSQAPDGLAEAVELYRGDFLAGFYVKEALDFEEWVLTERERLRDLVIGALDQLVGQDLSRGETGRGIERAGRLLALEPWRETAHRQLMLLLARSGQRAAALAQYDTCRRILAEELGVEPMAETTALYERLKVAGTPPPHNLPPPPNAFVGRETELQHLGRLLANPTCRLLTIVGPGGIGKTRLALEAARRRVETGTTFDGFDFTDGVYFIDLAPLGGTDLAASQATDASRAANLILTTVAAGLGFAWPGTADLQAQLFDYLAGKQMLLVLDNFEHLVEAAGLLAEWLQASPGVKFLITSRERLNIREEWVQEVGGLEYPPEGWKAGRLEGWKVDSLPIFQSSNLPPFQSSNLPIFHAKRSTHYSAVALFVQRAQQIQAGFALSEVEAPYVIQLCQLVEGAPLALELAASWLRVLTCAEVVAEIERSLDFLTSSQRNMPERHRSMRAVFEQSWQMLSAAEQTVFGQLSVFRGGFQREAARAVAGAGLPILTGLMDKSLLRLTPSGRYQMHELLRQFAAEKLLMGAASDQRPDSTLAVWERYSSYYLHLTGQREAGLRGGKPQADLAELRTEIDNIRQAWQWAVLAGQIEEIEGALGGLARFYDLTSLFQEGAEVFEQAAQDLQAQPLPSPPRFGEVAEASPRGGPRPELRPDAKRVEGPVEGETEGEEQTVRTRLIVKLWVEQARLLNRRGLPEQALQVIPQAAELAHQLQDPALEALAYQQWGETLSYHGQPRLSQARLEEALRLARAAGLKAIEAETLRYLGICRVYQADTAGAWQLFEEALACFRGLNDRRGEGTALHNLAHLQRHLGYFSEAETHYQQALHIFQEIDYRWGQKWVFNNLVQLRYDTGDYSQAQALCRQVMQICAEFNDYWGKCHMLNALGNILREQGDFAPAQSYYEQAISLWRKIGARLGEGVTLAELALAWHLLGRNKAAYECGQQAEQIAQEIGSPEIRATALTQLGHAQVELGFLPEAAASYRQALTLHQEAKQFYFAREALAGLMRVALAQGDLPQAQTYAAELLPQLEIENLYGTRQPFRVYLTCYQVLQAGHDPRAGEVLATAHRLLHERAAKIEDERLRHSFLENVPAHRELVREFQKAPGLGEDE